jgi:hypothetical protein
VTHRPSGSVRGHSALALRRPDVAGLLHDRTVRLLWIVYCGMSAADCLSTGRALGLGLRERNPLAASLYEHAGIASLWAIKAVVLGAILFGLSALPRRAAAAVTAVFALSAVVTVLANLQALAGG